MQSGTQNSACGHIGDTSQDYRKAVERQKDPHAFEAAIRALVPERTHNEICALFDRRVPYSSIKKWRQGKRPAPQWAIDRLATLLDRNIESQAQLAARVRAIVPGPGKGSTRNIARWNERRAREQINVGRRIMKLTLEAKKKETSG